MSGYASTSNPAGTVYSAVDIGGVTYYQYTSGGSAVSTTVAPVLQGGDTLYVGSGAVASGVETTSGGIASVVVNNGGELLSSTINNGYVYVSSGGVASGNTENSNLEYVYSGGSSVDETILNTTVGDAQTLYIYSGGTADGDLVVSSGLIQNANGATISNITVGASGTLSNTAGTVSGLTVLSGGSAYNTDTVSGAVVASGGSLSSTDAVTDLTVQSGGGYAGAASPGATVDAGGAVTNGNPGIVYSAVDVGGVTYYEYTDRTGATVTTTTPVVLQGGDVLYVEAGAVASGVQSISGGVAQVVILSGGELLSSTINNGYVYVSSGGIASGNTENSNLEYVYSGGTSIDETILMTVADKTGYTYVYGGGSAVGDLVVSSGALLNENGGTVSNITIGASGTLSNTAGTATGITVSSGGSAYNSDVLSGAVVSSGGLLSSTDAVSGLTVHGSGAYAGAASPGATVDGGGAVTNGNPGIVYSAVDIGGVTYYEYTDRTGAVVSSTTPVVLQNGDVLYVESGAVASGVQSISGGIPQVFVLGGGELLSSTINNAYVYVSSGGIASGNTENSNLEYVYSGGSSIDETILNTTVGDAQTLYVYAGGTADGDLVVSSGLFQNAEGATISNITVGASGTLSNSNGTVDGLKVTSGGVVVNGGTINDFQIYSGGLVSGTTGTYNSGSMAPNASLVGSATDIQALCFYPGTMLETPDGAVAVEDVQPGDMVMTADGTEKAVRWVGQSNISTLFGDPVRVLPIRIAAGALGEALPTRDLLLSPDHAIFLGGVLVQASALVNGVTITRESNVPEVFTYYHVELSSHELLVAEGVAAESFVDNVDRMHFANWAERDTAKAVAPIEEMPYPRAMSIRQVPLAVRAAIEARAAGLAKRAASAA